MRRPPIPRRAICRSTISSRRAAKSGMSVAPRRQHLPRRDVPMPESDANFPSEIAALYDRCLRPFLFEPYAEDLARRAAALRPTHILETAAGTGVVTEAVMKALPEAEIVATDLNRAMLDVAQARLGGRPEYREV